MRWLAVALLCMSVFAALFAAASSQPQPRAASGCTETGTLERDTLSGTDGDDVICAKAGDDYVHGRAGDDVLKGGAGRDSLVGAEDRDRVVGGSGADRLFLVDGRGGELANGGKGKDWCYIDHSDRTRGCEHIYVGTTLAVVKAQTDVFGDVVAIAEMQGEELTATITPVTTPITTFPACDTNPNC